MRVTYIKPSGPQQPALVHAAVHSSLQLFHLLGLENFLRFQNYFEEYPKIDL
jgi:hypothetical protein